MDHNISHIVQIYEEVLGNYLHKPDHLFLTHKQVKYYTKKWMQVIEFSQELDVSPELYIKAQFYFFHKWFSRHPKPYELCSTKSKVNSKERTKLYLAAIKRGEVKAYQTSSPVIPKSQINQDIKSHHSQMQLLTFMKNYNTTEEEVLKRFAKGSLASLFFDPIWLQNNQVYQLLKQSGQL